MRLVNILGGALLQSWGVRGSICERYGSEWICGESMCRVPALTKASSQEQSNPYSSSSIPQTQSWAPHAYQGALALFDAMQLYLADHPSLPDPSARLLPPNGTHQKSPTENSARKVQHENHLHHSMLKEAISALQGSLRLYGPEGIYASFNGGKDATVVVNLYVAVLADYYRQNNIQDRRKPRTVYFHVPRDFESVRHFIYNQAEKLDLDLRVYEGGYKQRLGSFLNDISGTQNKGTWERHPAFLIGLRDGDPGSQNVGIFEPVSTWLCTELPYMRVHPILKWTYGAVWAFFDEFSVPYCPLYDEGYSSLGQISETRQNLLLARGSDAGWTQAKYLAEWSAERTGREST